MMKYLWISFVLCLITLTAQVKLGSKQLNPVAEGKLACLPLPPALHRPDPVMLPAPILEKIPPPSMPARVEATSIEIFNDRSGAGIMEETRHADNADWGLPRSIPKDNPMELAYAPEAKLVAPVPVNTPVPVQQPASPQLQDLLPRTEDLLTRPLDKWSSSSLLARVYFKAAKSDSPLHDAATAEIESESSATAIAHTELALYPVPGKEPIVTASLDPKRLISSAPGARNLYLPDGATDEEGAMLTLINHELAIYELPDETSSAGPHRLREGDQVRPVTRLRNSTGFDWIKFDWDGKAYWAQAEYFIRVDPRNRKNTAKGNLEPGTEKVDKDSALPAEYEPNDLKEIHGKYTFGAKNVMLRADAVDAFHRMAEAAERDGRHIRVFSGFRDFSYQKRLYLEAVRKEGPKQDGTAAPGYSEHQLGTTADICNDNRRTILSGTFGETPEGRWLHENSEKYGFRKSYTSENTQEVGYKPEPWHFRYLGDISNLPADKSIARE